MKEFTLEEVNAMIRQYSSLRKEVLQACADKNYDALIELYHRIDKTNPAQKMYVWEILCSYGQLDGVRHFIKHIPESWDWLNDGLSIAAINAYPQLVSFFVTIGADVNCYHSLPMRFVLEEISYCLDNPEKQDQLKKLYECAKILRDAGSEFPDTEIYSNNESMQRKIESIIEQIKNS